MSSITTIGAGVTADQSSLDKYENAVRMNHEAEHRDEAGQGLAGVLSKIGMGDGGAVVGVIGITAATWLTSIQGNRRRSPPVTQASTGLLTSSSIA